MFAVTTYIAPERVAAKVDLKSRKRVFDCLSELLTPKMDDEQEMLIQTQSIQSALIQREKLGSTALGNGIAVPHASIKSIKHPIIAIVTLAEPIDFDSPDGQAADIFTGLLFPNPPTELAKSTMQALENLLQQPKFINQLRQSETDQALYNVLLMAAALEGKD